MDSNYSSLIDPMKRHTGFLGSNKQGHLIQAVAEGWCSLKEAFWKK